jgi:hypothetical protein
MPSYNFESSGKLSSPSGEELQKADATSAIIAYTNGVANDGRPYYAYIAVKPSRYREFYELTSARKTIVLNDFGDIIEGDFEAAPPAHVVQRMREEYGFDENYERELKEEVSRQRDKFSAQQEEKRLMDIVAMMKARKA